MRVQHHHFLTHDVVHAAYLDVAKVWPFIVQLLDELPCVSQLLSFRHRAQRCSLLLAAAHSNGNSRVQCLFSYSSCRRRAA